MAVVWEETSPGKYVFANGFELEDWQSVTVSTADAAAEAFVMTGFSESGRLTTVIKDLFATSTVLTLADAGGKVLEETQLPRLAGERTIHEWSAPLPTGIYLVSLSANGRTRTVQHFVP